MNQNPLPCDDDGVRRLLWDDGDEPYGVDPLPARVSEVDRPTPVWPVVVAVLLGVTAGAAFVAAVMS